MNTNMHELGGGDSGQDANVGYPGSMTSGVAGYDSLFRILWRGWWLIVLCTVVALGCAGLYLRFAPPKYESTSRLLVDKPNPQPRSDAPLPAGSTLMNYLATQASMITSPEIIAAALTDPNVLVLPGFRDPNYVKDLIETLTADVAKKVDIIQITASSSHPEDAARMVNAVVRAYVRWHEANRLLSTADLLKDMNAQLDKRYSELQQKRKEQLMFEQRHPEVLESIPGGMMSKSLEMLRDELIAARLNTLQRDSYYQGLSRLEKEPDAFREYVFSHQASEAVAAVTATVAAGEHSERVRLELQLEETRRQMEEIGVFGTARNTRLTMLQNRQSELEKKIADFDVEFMRQHVLLAKTNLEDARTQEQKVTEIYEKEFAKLQNLGEQDAQYAFLKSECEMMETLCSSLVGQIDQLDLGARLEGLKIHVLQKALPALKPSSPQPFMVLPLGLMLGLMAGAGLAFLRDWRDQRVRSADEITTICGAPVLGTVPSMSRRLRTVRSQLLSAPNSHASESYRVIRTALFFGVPREEARTVLVTSPAPLEGKTTLVSNLGIAMAQAGQRTLILDADLRKPMQHHAFAMNGHGKGLCDVLDGTATLEQAIRTTAVPGLYVLAGKQSVDNPSEVLSGSVFTKLLQEVARRFDRVLVDSPPLGVAADAQVLAALCDLTLLVLRADHSTRGITLHARDLLLTVGARVAGVVVNDVSEKDSRYSGYGAYKPYLGHYGSDSGQTAREKSPLPAD